MLKQFVPQIILHLCAHQMAIIGDIEVAIIFDDGHTDMAAVIMINGVTGAISEG